MQPIHQQLMAVPGQSKIEKIFLIRRPWRRGRNLLMSIIQTLNWRSLPVQPTLRAMFPSIQISLCGHCPQKFGWRIWFGINCSRYSRNGSQFHSFLGFGSQGTTNALECKCLQKMESSIDLCQTIYQELYIRRFLPLLGAGLT